MELTFVSDLLFHHSRLIFHRELPQHLAIEVCQNWWLASCLGVGFLLWCWAFLRGIVCQLVSIIVEKLARLVVYFRREGYSSVLTHQSSELVGEL